MKYIEDMMGLLGPKHELHMKCYGAGNENRMTGIHETASFDKFSYGVGNRGASIRIPSQTKNQNGKGYIEDRRPASNIDPYVVTALILDSCCGMKQADELVEHYQKWSDWLPTAGIEQA